MILETKTVFVKILSPLYLPKLHFMLEILVSSPYILTRSVLLEQQVDARIAYFFSRKTKASIG